MHPLQDGGLTGDLNHAMPQDTGRVVVQVGAELGLCFPIFIIITAAVFLTTFLLKPEKPWAVKMPSSQTAPIPTDGCFEHPSPPPSFPGTEGGR